MAIKHIKEISQPTKIDIIIPAAGLGRRMKTYGPKSLIKIPNSKNITILEHQLKIIKQTLNFGRLILVCGFRSDFLMNHSSDDFIKIENENFEETNVVRSIGMGLRACKHEVLIIYGDLVFNQYAIKAMNFNKSSILVGKNIMSNEEIGCIANSKSYIENMMYDLPLKWGQITFLKGKELKLMQKYCWNPDNNKKYGFEAINEVVNNGGRFEACEHKKAKVIDIDTIKDIELIKDIV